MFNRIRLLAPLLIVPALVFLTGCDGNAGDHPPVHATKKVEDMTPQEKIDRIAHSPLPQAEKDRLIAQEQAKPAAPTTP